MDISPSLRHILTTDPLGILDLPPKVSFHSSDAERIQSKFNEIKQFHQDHNRPPQASSHDLYESMLYARANVFKNDVKIVELLQDSDPDKICQTHHYQDHSSAQPQSMDDILSHDPLGVLSQVATPDIFQLKHVPSPSPRVPADYVAYRTPCEDFHRFKSKFSACYFDLHCGKKAFIPPSNTVNKGDFYMLKNMIVYVAELSAEQKTQDRPTRRLRCIFENGTESHMLKQESFLKSLRQKNGKQITVRDFKNTNIRNQGFAGYIYIARSLSQNPNIMNIPHLHKIGLSTQLVDQRIQNANKESTYLKSPVTIVRSIPCFYLHLQKLESALHQFFAKVCLDIRMRSVKGDRSKPQEWFMVPHNIIEEAIKLIFNNTIELYDFDAEHLVIRRK
ncbi:MAG: GIY-YIG nuclease family protein [Proteobacteria bacterium]|nr:GIY-YIG nuclease family protein [Pseudomonadota bacterium]